MPPVQVAHARCALYSFKGGWLKSDDGSMGWGLDWGGTEQSRTGNSAGQLVVTRAGCQRDVMVTRTGSNQGTMASGLSGGSGRLTDYWKIQDM